MLQSHVEDTKGNNGEQGQLTMTNLRLMWVSDKSHRTNLTLGYNCIVSINIKEASSRLRGTSSASSVSCQHVFGAQHRVICNLSQHAWSRPALNVSLYYGKCIHGHRNEQSPVSYTVDKLDALVVRGRRIIVWSSNHAPCLVEVNAPTCCSQNNDLVQCELQAQHRLCLS